MHVVSEHVQSVRADRVPEGGLVRHQGELWFRVAWRGPLTNRPLIRWVDHDDGADSPELGGSRGYPALFARLADGRVEGLLAESRVEYLPDARVHVPARAPEANR